MQALNVGCGGFPRPGFLNVDISPFAKADLCFDLNRVPFPLRAETFDLIVASHVLEHLTDPFAAMAEFARLLRPGGRLEIKVPHFSRGFMHPQHCRGFDVSFPLYFHPEFPGGYCGVEYVCEFLQLRWLAQPDLKRQVLPPWQFRGARLVGLVCDRLAALSPALCSRVWAFWVGGFEEIEFHFRCVKGAS
jgi:SAM-dependent methyltransferase